MMWAEIPGRERIKKELLAMADDGRVPHALMFIGPEGNGGLALAIGYAAYLLCENPAGGEACGDCKQCRWTARHIHPDVHFTFPVIARKGTEGLCSEFYEEWRELLAQNPYPSLYDWIDLLNAENKQVNINKNECLRIVNRLALRPAEGRFKIQIIWLPEYLGKEGNRLLKIIEEPPPDTLFFFVAQTTEKILPTIVSRCQMIHVPAFTDDEIAQFAQTKWNLDENNARQLALLSEGNMSAAFKAVKEEGDELSDLFIRWMRLAFRDKDGRLIEMQEELAGLGRERQKQLLALALRLFRMMLMARMTGAAPAGLREQEQQFVTKMAGFVDFDGLERLARLFNEAHYAVERNANPKILFLDLSFKTGEVFHRLAT